MQQHVGRGGVIFSLHMREVGVGDGGVYNTESYDRSHGEGQWSSHVVCVYRDNRKTWSLLTCHMSFGGGA